MRGECQNPKATLLIGFSAMTLLSCAPVTGAPQVRPVQSAAAPARDMLYESAVSAIGKRDYARALDYLQEARARDPRDSRVLNAMGVIYDKLGRFDLSARYYTQARDVDPASKIVASNMAYSKVLQGLSHQDPVNLAMVQPTEVVPMTPNTVSQATTEYPVPSSSPVRVLPQSARIADAVPAIPLSRPTPRPVASLRVTVAAQPAIAVAIHQAASPVKAVVTASAAAQQSACTAAQVQAKPHDAPAIPNSVIAHRQSAVLPGANALMVPTFKPITAHPPAQDLALRTPSAKPVLITGHPLLVMDATGHADKARIVGYRLAKLGWTVRASSVSSHQIQTQLSYAPQNAAVALAMQHTLPFRVHMKADASELGLKLTVGQDFLSWKPRNTRLEGLWQSRVVRAFLTSSSAKGENP